MELKVGADPELWIFDKDAEKIISADGLFEGSKDNPFPVTHGAVQVDGMAAEYNINPAKTSGEFILNNLSVLRDLRDIIAKNNPKLNFDLRFGPVARFGKEYIDAQPEDAKRLGCTPDFNAYEGGAQNPIPDAETPFRTASGHIHLGWANDVDITDPEHLEACCMMIKQLDAYMGYYFPGIEGPDGLTRRELYGKAGAFRPKSYGAEYRTPSNVWLNSVRYMSSVFELAQGAFSTLMRGERYYEYNEPFNMVRDWIDGGKADHIRANLGYWSAPSVKDMVTTNSLDELVERYRKYDVNKLLPKVDRVIPVVDWVNVGAVLPGVADKANLRNLAAEIMNGMALPAVARPDPILDGLHPQVAFIDEADDLDDFDDHDFELHFEAHPDEVDDE